jgi:hypothetical protein
LALGNISNFWQFRHCQLEGFHLFMIRPSKNILRT